jgi:serine/threonine protein kinase
MGDVYKARDTRLNRTVAIKALQSSVSADPERIARFEREAQIPGVSQPLEHRRPSTGSSPPAITRT